MNNELKPTISAIVAMDENRAIGINNQLPWHLPADLKHFKEITTGHPILMGRKTYESIGKPLPNRLNIIITRDKNFQAANCMIVHSLSEALDYASDQQAQEIFIIGGAEVFKQLLPQIRRLYLTIVHHIFAGDTFFPALNLSEWQEISRRRHQADEKNAYDYSFITLERLS